MIDRIAGVKIQVAWGGALMLEPPGATLRERRAGARRGTCIVHSWVSARVIGSSTNAARAMASLVQ